jgi:histidinol-phosphatase (PHP family)
VHSYYSFDNDQSIEAYLIVAREKKLSSFVLTDHIDLNYLDEGKDLTFDISKQHEELARLQIIYPEIHFLKGVEIGYKPSELVRIENILSSYDFDLVNLSLHESDGMDYYMKDEFVKRGVRSVLDVYFQRLLDMVNNYENYDVLSHIDFGFKTAFLLDNSVKLKDYEEILKKILLIIINKGKVLEINTKVQMFLPIDHTRYLLRLYKNLGGKELTLSSDAHDKNRLCGDFDKYIKIIKEEGFTHLVRFIKRNKSFLSI